MSTIFNAMDKKLVVYSDKEDKDLQKLKKFKQTDLFGNRI